MAHISPDDKLARLIQKSELHTDPDGIGQRNRDPANISRKSDLGDFQTGMEPYRERESVPLRGNSCQNQARPAHGQIFEITNRLPVDDDQVFEKSEPTCTTLLCHESALPICA